MWLPATSALADSWTRSGVSTSSCVGSYGMSSCAGRWHERKDYGTPSREIRAQEVAESRERDRKWMERCKPVVRQDAYGIDYASYAAPGCEFGKFAD
jgi:hypothetical protein